MVSSRITLTIRPGEWTSDEKIIIVQSEDRSYYYYYHYYYYCYHSSRTGHTPDPSYDTQNTHNIE